MALELTPEQQEACNLYEATQRANANLAQHQNELVKSEVALDTVAGTTLRKLLDFVLEQVRVSEGNYRRLGVREDFEPKVLSPNPIVGLMRYSFPPSTMKGYGSEEGHTDFTKILCINERNEHDIALMRHVQARVFRRPSSDTLTRLELNIQDEAAIIFRQPDEEGEIQILHRLPQSCSILANIYTEPTTNDQIRIVHPPDVNPASRSEYIFQDLLDPPSTDGTYVQLYGKNQLSSFQPRNDKVLLSYTT